MFQDFKNLDQLAAGDTIIHLLDPRAKVMVTVFFIITVISFGRYELTALLPFFIFPVVLIALGNLPPYDIAKRVAIVIPFAVMVGIFNPLLDRHLLLHTGTLGISGGWVSFGSLLIRAVLSVAATVTLIGVTGFPAICSALEAMGVPQAFTIQMLFLYRYIFVLTEEGSRASRARDLRSFGPKGRGIKSHGSMLGHLLLRTWQRAERIHAAMLARGFTGKFHNRRCYRFGREETIFILGWSLLFIFMRLENASELIGSLLMGMLL
jgi:cobalt/nickel transport system permease protein